MRRLADLLADARRSPTLRTTAVLGVAGVGFAAANLILARVLSRQEYALFALAVTFFNVGIPLAPLGADVVVNRRRIAPDGALLRRVLTTSATVALAAVAISSVVYGLQGTVLPLIGLSVAAGGANYVVGSHYQSQRRFRTSLFFVQGINFVLLGAALATVGLGATTARLPLTLMTATYVALAVFGWAKLLREKPSRRVEPEALRWREALSCVGVTGVAILLGQFERLAIPRLLSMDALATYGVLAAVVGSVFRMLWIAAGYTLLPRLRTATGPVRRRLLLWREARTVGVVVLVVAVGIWFVAAPLVEGFLAGKYELPPALVLAALIGGVVKVASAFSRAAATALTDNRQLAQLNTLGWLSLAVAVGGVWVGAHWGLTGVLYGVSLGWLCQGAFAAMVVAPHLKRGVHRVTPAVELATAAAPPPPIGVGR